MFDTRQVSSQAKLHGFVLFDASSGTPTTTRSKNLSSITDDGVGLYTVNWVTSNVSAETAYVTSAAGSTVSGCMTGLKNSNPPTVNTTPIKASSSTNSSGTDLTRIGLAVFRAR